MCLPSCILCHWSCWFIWQADDPSLTELNLNNHSRIDSNLIDQLIEAMRGNTSLTKLQMANVRFTEDHAQVCMLVYVLASSPAHSFYNIASYWKPGVREAGNEGRYFDHCCIFIYMYISSICTWLIWDSNPLLLVTPSWWGLVLAETCPVHWVTV